MATRRRAREVVLQMLFQLEASGASPQRVVDTYRTAFGEGPLPDDFSIQLFTAISASLQELDQLITSASENWRIERMSRVDRNILRMGVYELMLSEDTPPVVAINEAVELAKRFGTEDSASFVNGILDRIGRDTRRLA
jgi:N utilization substance protein B